ncbi:Clp protease N-terminal domain-containing protein [Tomitella gaofuii]|uniref:Clp protease N-terminal domain-containing protein n=1 Tax=Tomitella gaofuii TaxID=2760083 RepID=UPI0015FC7F5E|nr:Clp protease N-terminal domain-containing protein [Tomitella gaofuii]
MTDNRPPLIDRSARPADSGPAMPYTQGTHDALVAAQAVSRPSAQQAGPESDRHASVTAAHLMLAILAETGSTATRAFTDQGLRLGRARMRVAALTLPPPDRVERADGPLTPIDAVLAEARSDAARRRHRAVGTGHLLIALTAPHALADELTGLGLDVSAAVRFVCATYAATPPRPRDTGREFA